MKRWFQNLKIRGKLTLGFSLVLLFLGIIGLTGYISIKTIAQNLDEIFQVRLPSIDYILETDRDLYQALVAERSMIFTEPNSKRFQEFKEFYEENLEQADNRWESYKTFSSSDKEKALIPEYEKARDEWELASQKVIDSLMAETVTDNQREAIDLALGPAKEKFEEMRTFLDQLTEFNLKSAAKAHQTAQRTYKTTVVWFLTIAGIGLAVGGVLAVVISRQITIPLKEAVVISRKLAEGDLTQSIAIETRDETGQLLSAMNDMLKILRNVVNDAKDISNTVVSGSQQLSSSATQMSQGANSQASAAEEISSSMQQMSSNISQNANNASQTEKIAANAVEDALKSRKAVKKTIKAMKKIADEITIVAEIAKQTRMLSLNATIEAGKAHEYGKGFVVVASEVRELAERSRMAAQKITTLVDSGVTIVDKTGNRLTSLVPGIQKTAELVQEINAASGEQDIGARQINEAIQQLDRVTQQNSATSEELASTAEELANQSRQFQETIAFFKVEETAGNPEEKKDFFIQEADSPGAAEMHQSESLISDKTEKTTDKGITLYIHPNKNGVDEQDNEFERY